MNKANFKFPALIFYTISFWKYFTGRKVGFLERMRSNASL